VCQTCMASGIATKPGGGGIASSPAPGATVCAGSPGPPSRYVLRVKSWPRVA
jgi:hypothetical protein